MKKKKTVKALVATAVDSGSVLQQPIGKWLTMPEMSKMTSFSENIANKYIYLDRERIAALVSLVKDNELYVSIDTLRVLGFDIKKTKSKIIINGKNKIVIDPLTLRTELNDLQIKLDAVQVSGDIFISLAVITEYTGVLAEEKTGSLYLTTTDREFTLETGHIRSVIYSYKVLNNILYVAEFVLYLALPSFKRDGTEIYDTVTGKSISLTKHEKDGMYALLAIIQEAGGKTVTDRENSHFKIEHSSTEYIEETKRELNFARSLAANAPIETDSLEEAIINEINAYRTILNKPSVAEGSGTILKGFVIINKITNIAKAVYLAMTFKEYKELLMGEIQTVSIKTEENKIQVLAYAG